MVIPLIVWAALIFVALIILLWFFPVALWFQAILSGVRVSLLQLVLMRWRGVNPNTIVMALITGTKAGLTLKANELEAHYLAKGNVVKVVNALISADKANIALNIYNTMYGTTGWQGVGQAKAVIFFILVAVIAIVQNKLTTSKEVQE